jgi:hypothetical protein
MNPKTKLLRWELKDSETIRGYLRGHPEITLYLINTSRGEQRLLLLGAGIPDTEEHELWPGRENAQAAAEQYLLDWVKLAADTIASNDPRELPPTGDPREPKTL